MMSILLIGSILFGTPHSLSDVKFETKTVQNLSEKQKKMRNDLIFRMFSFAEDFSLKTHIPTTVVSILFSDKETPTMAVVSFKNSKGVFGLVYAYKDGEWQVLHREFK